MRQISEFTSPSLRDNGPHRQHKRITTTQIYADTSLRGMSENYYPSPAAEPNADGSTTICFAPEQPEGVPRGNWIQTMPGNGWL
jgi:hypothetical protein